MKITIRVQYDELINIMHDAHGMKEIMENSALVFLLHLNYIIIY